MGEVYKARDARLGREVALKILPPEFAHDRDRRTRFEHEARAVAALNHPGMVALYDIGNEDDTHYIVNELVDGATLRAALANGPLPARKTSNGPRRSPTRWARRMPRASRTAI